jgi:hypothetical protein
VRAVMNARKGRRPDAIYDGEPRSTLHSGGQTPIAKGCLWGGVPMVKGIAQELQYARAQPCAVARLRKRGA